MSVISKELFYEKISDKPSCREIHFWTNDCFRSGFTPYFLSGIIKGAGTFFLPIYLLRMYLDYKKKRKNVLRRFINREIRAILYAISLGGGLLTFICLLNKLWGRLHYYSIVSIPAFLTGPSLLIAPYEDQILNTLLFFNSFIETLLKKLRLTLNEELLLFMSASAMLMHFFQHRTKNLDFTYFWFYTPPLHKNMIVDEEKCQHAGICRSFLNEGVVNYFLVGYGINMTKSMLSQFKGVFKNPANLFKILFNKSNAEFGLFVAAYVGIHRFVLCYLTKSKKLHKSSHGALAGALAGISYMISPNIQMLVIAITTVLQILYDKICKKYKITNNFYQRLLIYSFTHAYNIHNKFFYPDTSSSYYYKMLDACTNNVTHAVFGPIFAKYFS